MSQQDTSKIFATRLRETRIGKDLDQAQLAAEAGIPTTSISHFESGRRKPSLLNLRNLAEALEVSIDYLLGRTDDPAAHIAATVFRDEYLLSKKDQEFLKEVKAHLSRRTNPSSE